jgi:hypothetical protein
MIMPRQPDTPQSSHERLRHSPNEMVIGLSISPQGRRCIGMTFADTEWVFLTAKTPIFADQLRKALQTDFSIDSLPGAPFDVHETLDKGELALIPDTPAKAQKPIGIFVPSERFDELIDAGIY